MMHTTTHYRTAKRERLLKPVFGAAGRVRCAGHARPHGCRSGRAVARRPRCLAGARLPQRSAPDGSGDPSRNDRGGRHEDQGRVPVASERLPAGDVQSPLTTTSSFIPRPAAARFAGFFSRVSVEPLDLARVEHRSLRGAGGRAAGLLEAHRQRRHVGQSLVRESRQRDLADAGPRQYTERARRRRLAGSIHSSSDLSAGTGAPPTVLTVIVRLSRATVATSAGCASWPARTTTIGCAGCSRPGCISATPSPTAATKLATAKPRQKATRVHQAPRSVTAHGVEAEPQRDAPPHLRRRRDRRRGFGQRRKALLPGANRRGNDRVRARDVREPRPRASRQRAEHVRRSQGVEAGEAVGTGQVHPSAPSPRDRDSS